MKHVLPNTLHPHFTNHHTNQYDTSFQRDTTFIVGGLVLLVVFFISSVIIQAAVANDPGSSRIVYALCAVIALVVRIGAAKMVVSYAKKLNRDHIAWGLFAFLLPAVAMIIIGQKNRFKVHA